MGRTSGGKHWLITGLLCSIYCRICWRMQRTERYQRNKASSCWWCHNVTAAEPQCLFDQDVKLNLLALQISSECHTIIITWWHHGRQLVRAVLVFLNISSHPAPSLWEGLSWHRSVKFPGSLHSSLHHVSLFLTHLLPLRINRSLLIPSHLLQIITQHSFTSSMRVFSGAQNGVKEIAS